MGDETFTRREIIRSTATAAVWGVVSRMTPAVQANTPEESEDGDVPCGWSQFGATEANTGALTDLSGPVAPGPRRWKLPADERAHAIVIDRSSVYATDGSELYARRRSDGALEWRVVHDHNLLSAPAISDGHIYVGCRATDRSGTIRAYDTSSGTTEWTVTPPTPVTGISPPTVSDGIVYAVGYGFGAGTDDRLYALDERTGTIHWSRSTGPSSIARETTAGVAVGDGNVIIAGNALQSVDPRTGEPHWTQRAPTSFKTIGTTAPSVANGRVFCTRQTDAGPMVECRDLADGTLQWHVRIASESNRPLAGGRIPMAVDGTAVYVGYTNDRNQHATISALAIRDGAECWHASFDRETHQILGLAVTSETLYTHREAINTSDGTIRWQAPADLETGPPAIAREMVCFGGESVVAFDTQATT
ncbi:outer membrane protein assembly factor BamB family protein [Halocatena halophila]|uniref:outer membrane protein assembly factor BamB family protein n=1 Tax=Halocatena halophila TaxID=2814576 RepID=UPI002ED3DEB6